MDGGRFDELTRGLASGMSRRKMLRGLAGAAAAGIAGGFVSTSSRALSQNKPSERAVVCPDVSLSPACDLPLDPSPFDALTCEAEGGRVVQTRQPTYNGICDVPGVKDNDFYDGARDRYGKASWEYACMAHDCCYDTCGTTRDNCDLNFWIDMTNSCEAAYPYNLVQRLNCFNLASTYYAGVSGPWNDGTHPYRQEMNCGCCAQGPIEVVSCGTCQVLENGVCVERTDCPNGCDPNTGACYESISTTTLSITYGTPENFHVSVQLTASGLQPYSQVFLSGEGVDGNGDGEVTVGEVEADDAFSSVGEADGNGNYSDLAYIECGSTSSLTLSGTAADGTWVSVTEPTPCCGPCEVLEDGAVCVPHTDCPNGCDPSTGACYPEVACPDGQTECGGVCVDLLTDPYNCGACGIACDTAYPFCVIGICTSIE